MINEGIKGIIEENAMGLATIGVDGNPHNIAVAYVKVVSDNELIISDNYLEETLKNIENNPKVSLVVWSENWKESCIGYELKGSAEYFNEGKWIDFIKKIPINKSEPCKGAIVIKINNVKVLS
jgi:uncharacterized protein